MHALIQTPKSNRVARNTSLFMSIHPKSIQHQDFFQENTEIVDHNVSQTPVLSNNIQSKLTINQTNDKYEQEADRVADQVMRMPNLEMGNISTRQKRTQTKTASVPETSSGFSPIAGVGTSLSLTERNFFEPRFGMDFSNVRVHADQRAASINQQIQSRAFTHGSDIYFNKGEYQSDSREGKRLLGHELTHVVQQNKHKQLLTKGLFVQCQTIPIPEFDEFDPCLIVPPGLPPPLDKASGQKVCGSHAKKLREILKGKKTREKKIVCPPGFKPGSASKFQNKCCIKSTTIHSDQNCCHPIRANWLSATCCPQDELYNPVTKKCEVFKLPPLSLPKLPVPIATPPAKPPTTKQSPIVLPQIEVKFNFDRPKVGEVGERQALNAEGQSELNKLIKLLLADQSFKVQLIGSASPIGTKKYNKDLGERRARSIAKIFEDSGINRSRISDAPQFTPLAGCNRIASGIFNCGEIGAVGQKDQKVTVNVFKIL